MRGRGPVQAYGNRLDAARGGTSACGGESGTHADSDCCSAGHCPRSVYEGLLRGVDGKRACGSGAGLRHGRWRRAYGRPSRAGCRGCCGRGSHDRRRRRDACARGSIHSIPCRKGAHGPVHSVEAEIGERAGCRRRRAIAIWSLRTPRPIGAFCGRILPQCQYRYGGVVQGACRPPREPECRLRASRAGGCGLPETLARVLRPPIR